MDIPNPDAGLVINYSFLWGAEAAKGRSEGVKDRPCAVVLAVATKDGQCKIAVAPITHTKPDQSRRPIAIPPLTAKRLGLDEEPQWIVTDELNMFIWPGFDMRPIPGSSSQSPAYGFLPYDLIKKLKQAVASHITRKSAAVTRRDDD